MKSRRQDTRSEDTVKDSNEKLRAENRKLRKQISQLQSENNKLRQLDTRDEWEAVVYEEATSRKEEAPLNDKCPKCKEELTLIEAGIFEIRVCNKCGWKKRKKLAFADNK